MRWGMYKFSYPDPSMMHSFGIAFHRIGEEYFMQIHFWKWQIDIGYMFFEERVKE